MQAGRDRVARDELTGFISLDEHCFAWRPAEGCQPAREDAVAPRAKVPVEAVEVLALNVEARLRDHRLRELADRRLQVQIAQSGHMRARLRR